MDCSERLGSLPDEMGIPQLHCLPSVAAAFWRQGFLITSVMCPLLLYSHLANAVRILSAFCQLVQDFSGRSLHYMGIGKEADVVGGTAM